MSISLQPPQTQNHGRYDYSDEHIENIAKYDISVHNSQAGIARRLLRDIFRT